MASREGLLKATWRTPHETLQHDTYTSGTTHELSLQQNTMSGLAAACLHARTQEVGLLAELEKDHEGGLRPGMT